MAGHETLAFDDPDALEKNRYQLKITANNFLKTQKLSSPDIYICVPTQLFIQRIIELPMVAKENLHATIGYEIEKYIPFSPEDIYFDYQVLHDRKEANRLQLILLAIKRDTIAPYIELSKEIGNGTAGIEISATAHVNCLNYLCPEAATKNFFYLMNDGFNCNLGLLKHGRLHYAKAFELPVDRQKDPLANELIRIKRQLENDNDPSPLHVIDDGTGIENVAAVFKESLPDYSLMSLNREKMPNVSYAAAFGLALKGLVKTPMQVNFLPSPDRKKPNKLGSYIMYTMAGAFILSAAMFGASYVLHERMRTRETNARLESLKADVEHVNVLAGDIEKLRGQVNQLVSLRNKQAMIIDILKELTTLIPKSAWLKELQMNGNVIHLVGVAASASDLVTILEDSPLFYDAVFLSAITKDNDGNEMFRIGVKIESGDERGSSRT